MTESNAKVFRHVRTGSNASYLKLEIDEDAKTVTILGHHSLHHESASDDEYPQIDGLFEIDKNSQCRRIRLMPEVPLRLGAGVYDVIDPHGPISQFVKWTDASNEEKRLRELYAQEYEVTNPAPIWSYRPWR